MTAQRLCHIDTIPEAGSKGFKLGSDNLFAVKQGGQVYVYRNACPHIGVALEWVEDQFLDLSNSMIQCANHGALFMIDSGECVTGPCSGQSLSAIPYEIIDHEIFVHLDEDA